MSHLPEGEEPPPPGVKVMAVVRWVIIAGLAATAAWAFLSVRPAPSSLASSEAVGEVWQCPMHPAIIRDRPGQCPICHMDLVKVEKHDHAGSIEGLPELTT